MGNVKHSSRASLTALLPSLLPSFLCRDCKKKSRQVVAVPLSLCSKAGWGEVARQAEPQDVPAERSCCQHRAQSGLRTRGCALFGHTRTCEGAEKAAPSSHLRDSHTLGTGSGTGLQQEQGVGWGQVLGRKMFVLPHTWTALEGKA